MIFLPVLLLAVVVPAADQNAKADKNASPPARVTITAEVACLHCTFGEGESCAVCLKLDDKTPVLLAGKAAWDFEDIRLERTVLVIEGILSVDENKRLVLTSEKGRPLADKDKGKVPEKGDVQITGTVCCGKCDLALCDSCTLAIRNRAHPIVLDGKLARREPEKGKKTATVTGRLFRDKHGTLRLDAKKVDLQ